MTRRWISVLAISLSLLLAGADSMAGQKSRSGRKSSTRVKKKSTKGSKASARSKRGGSKNKKASSRSRKRGKKHARSRRSRRGRASASSASTSRPSGISTERVTEIQNALLKAGYYDAEPTGKYDEATIQAMKEFQTRNGISATGLPSAHTLKKLGVSKRSADGYAVPVVHSEESREKRPPADG